MKWLADTLSTAHLDSNEANQGEPARIMNIKTFGEIPDVQLEEIYQGTALDSSLQDVIQFVMEGWSEEKHFVSPCACPYFDIRHILIVVDGILLKREAVIIPPALRTSIKKGSTALTLAAKVCSVEQETACFGLACLVTLSKWPTLAKYVNK